MAYLIVPDKKQIRKIPLKKSLFFIGRARENDLTFPSDSLSRFHAQIIRKGRQYVIQDRGSLNGVFVNGTRILGETMLKDGDIVGVGDIYFRFFSEERDHLSEKPTALEMAQRFPIQKLVDSRRFEPEKKQKYLDRLYQFSSRLLQQSPSADVAETVLDLIQDVWNADRSCLMLKEGEQWQIATQRYGKNPRITPENLQISTMLMEELQRKEEALLVENRFQDQRFLASESLQRQNVVSLMCAPLWNNQKIYGFLYADLIFGNRTFSYDDLEMFAILANLMAMKWENDQLWNQALIQQQLEQELNLAGDIQRKFFPTASPDISNYDLSGITIPSRKVGGDAYFWHHRQDGKLVVMVADVMGKGLPSSLLMSQIQAIMKIFSEQQGDPAEIVTAVNQFIYRYSTQEKFISMVVLMIDPASGEVIFCNAGHNPPFILRKEKEVLLQEGGLPVGFFLDQVYARGKDYIQPGETIVLYTDGITEARDEKDEEFGLDRLVDMAREFSDLSAKEMAENMIRKIRDSWLAREPEDDWTLMIVKRYN